MLDWLGEEVPAHLDGLSLVPLMRGDTPEHWREHVVWEFNYRNAVSRAYLVEHGLTDEDCVMSVLRDHRFKHVAFPGSASVLIDLERDPHEMNNLAAEPAYAGIVQGYLEKQLRHRIRHSDRKLPPPPPKH